MRTHVALVQKKPPALAVKPMTADSAIKQIPLKNAMAPYAIMIGVVVQSVSQQYIVANKVVITIK